MVQPVQHTQPLLQENSNPLSFLRNLPQFRDLQRSIRSNPQLLQGLLQNIGQSNPQLLQVCSRFSWFKVIATLVFENCIH